MNYIHQMKRAIACRDAQLKSIDTDVLAFLEFLHSAKFTGEESGERKDWISTGDVIAWLRGMQSHSYQAGENAVMFWTNTPAVE